MTVTKRVVPHPAVAGPEVWALEPFFRDVTWSGTIVEGGMGLHSPEMTATGRGVHRVIQDGLWIVGDYEQDQHLLDGTFVLTWRLHWVVGWDPDRAAYTATYADNYGHAGVMHGRLEGARLVFETPAGAPVRLRMTWDAGDPKAMRWRNEMAVGDGPFALVEEYTCDPIASSPGAKAR